MSARREEAASAHARPMVGNAEARFGGLTARFALEVKLEDLSVAERRALFSALLRDSAVLTAAKGSPEYLALVDAVDGACKWEA